MKVKVLLEINFSGETGDSQSHVCGSLWESEENPAALHRLDEQAILRSRNPSSTDGSNKENHIFSPAGWCVFDHISKD